MTINWPDNLPLGIKYGATTEIGKNSKISTDMDYGNKLRRRRFTNVPAYQEVSVKFTDEQLEQFIYFYRSILLDGTVSFYANIIVGENIESRRCTIDNDSLKFGHDDFNYNTVSFIFEIFDFTGIAGGAEFLLGSYGEDYFLHTLFDPLEYEINVHIPAIYAV